MCHEVIVGLRIHKFVVYHESLKCRCRNNKKPKKGMMEKYIQFSYLGTSLIPQRGRRRHRRF